MKIYTKTGDAGKTSLLGGSRVAKYHLRIEAYGTIDELNSHVGMLRSYDLDKARVKQLIDIQNHLFVIGAQLATEPGDKKVKIPKLQEADVTFLEQSIDAMEEALPPMKNFVLPGGHLAVAQAHICRCVCRRGERIVLHLNDESDVPTPIPVYLNRLSDYFFVLSRKISRDLKAEETPWIPEKE